MNNLLIGLGVGGIVGTVIAVFLVCNVVYVNYFVRDDEHKLHNMLNESFMYGLFFFVCLSAIMFVYSLIYVGAELYVITNSATG